MAGFCSGQFLEFRADGRQTTPYSPAPDSDYVLIEPRLRQPHAFGVDEILHTLWLSPKVAACRH
jgi:hypothetical protein